MGTDSVLLRRAREIVIAWINRVPLEAMLDDDEMSRVTRPPNSDEVREAFRTLATAPETTGEEFAMFVAGNYRMFVAATERLSAREAAKRAKSDLDAWETEAEARRSSARSIWNVLIDLSPYIVIGVIIVAVYAGYAYVASQVVDGWLLLRAAERSGPLVDLAVIGISFGLTIAVFVYADKHPALSKWLLAVVLGLPWAIALTLHLFA